MKASTSHAFPLKVVGNRKTTNIYARANLDTKRKALEKLDVTARPGKPPRWKRDPELLTWLNSL
jgi:hypothetical protein